MTLTKKAVLLSLSAIVIIIFAGFAISQYLQKPEANVYLAQSPLPTLRVSPTPLVPVATPEPLPTATPTPTLYYPMSQYAERLTVRTYGSLIKPKDNAPLACGDQFSGYHTGDDVEAFSSELESDVPVYAISEGTIASISNVPGYGGLLVVRHTINGKTYLGYYGHIALNSVEAKVNDKVVAGQKIALLGDHCSSESSNERKHLHFSLRQQTTNDVRGYVETQVLLQQWTNPNQLLTSLQATNP